MNDSGKMSFMIVAIDSWTIFSASLENNLTTTTQMVFLQRD